MLEVHNLSKSYGQGEATTTAVGDVSFTIEQGSFTCLVGPSGCGKTTLLRCLSGLLEPTSGTVLFDGEEVTGPPEKMAFVFQDYSRSLMPWMTVRSNVALPLRYLDLSKAERAAATDEALAAVRLTAAADKYPWQLSGGMQQRVAIARALAYRPEVLLMDEPFASVDAQTRSELEDLMLDLWSTYGMTVLLVTHDIDEAVYLADRVLALSTSPSRVTGEFAIDLPRPRNQLDTKDLPQFAHWRTTVLKLIQRSSPAAGDDQVRPVEAAGQA